MLYMTVNIWHAIGSIILKENPAMPAKKYRVELSPEERTELSDLLRKGQCAAYKRRHAEVLLKADEGIDGSAWIDQQISEAFDVGECIVERIRQRLVEKGLPAALERAKHKHPRASKLDGEQEPHRVALACQSLRRDGIAGHYAYWHNRWWSWTTLMGYRMKRCVGF